MCGKIPAINHLHSTSSHYEPLYQMQQFKVHSENLQTGKHHITETLWNINKNVYTAFPKINRYSERRMTLDSWRQHNVNNVPVECC